MGRMRRIRWGKVEEEIDRKVTLVALRSFLLGVGDSGLGFGV